MKFRIYIYIFKYEQILAWCHYSRLLSYHRSIEFIVIHCHSLAFIDIKLGLPKLINYRIYRHLALLHTSCLCKGTKLSWRSSFILLLWCWCSFVAGRLLAAHCPWWPWCRHVINGILTNRTSMLFSPVQPNRGKVEGVSQHPCGWRWRSRWTPLPWSATGECINYWIFSYYNLMQQLTLNMEMSGTQHRLSFNLNLHI